MRPAVSPRTLLLAPAAPFRLARAYRRVDGQIARMRALAAGPEDELLATLPEVSGWSPAQHLEHLAITGLQVLQAIDRLRSAEGSGDGATGRRGPNLSGWLVVTLGHIPRGRAWERPEWSPERGDPERARAGLETLAGRLAALEPELPALAAARGTVPHPLLGGFTAARWVRFLGIHQAHHLAIVDDVRRAAARAGG
jgi:hypothetical protein